MQSAYIRPFQRMANMYTWCVYAFFGMCISQWIKHIIHIMYVPVCICVCYIYIYLLPVQNPSAGLISPSRRSVIKTAGGSVLASWNRMATFNGVPSSIYGCFFFVVVTGVTHPRNRIFTKKPRIWDSQLFPRIKKHPLQMHCLYDNGCPEAFPGKMHLHKFWEEVLELIQINLVNLYIHNEGLKEKRHLQLVSILLGQLCWSHSSVPKS